MSASHFAISLSSRARSAAKIDHALERQRRDLAAHDELHRALRRRIGKGDVGDAREPLHEFGPAPGPRLGLGRRADQHQRKLVAGAMFISARTERIAVTRSITQPISASASASSRPSCFGQASSASRWSRFGRLLCRDAPQLLGDERHERMQQLQDLVERPGGSGARLVLGGAVGAGEHRLGQLEIPVAVDVPDEAVGRAGRLVELVGFDRRR